MTYNVLSGTLSIYTTTTVPFAAAAADSHYDERALFL